MPHHRIPQQPKESVLDEEKAPFDLTIGSRSILQYGPASERSNPEAFPSSKIQFFRLFGYIPFSLIAVAITTLLPWGVRNSLFPVFDKDSNNSSVFTEACGSETSPSTERENVDFSAIPDTPPLPGTSAQNGAATCMCSSHLYLNDQSTENFLRSLFSGKLGYTLIGAKPASVLEPGDCSQNIDRRTIESTFNLLKHEFNKSTGFILKTLLTDTGYYRIEFINKQALKKTIAHYPELLSFLKRKFHKVDAFFQALNSPKSHLFDLIDYDPFLIGLILGYGKSNSDYYCRRCLVGNYLKKYPFFNSFQYNLEPHKGGLIGPQFDLELPFQSEEKPSIQKSFLSLEDEWLWIKSISWDLENDRTPPPPLYIPLPFYICRHGGDSEVIRDKYIKGRDYLANLYCKHTFREVIVAEASK